LVSWLAIGLEAYMADYAPTIRFTAREVLILIQLIETGRADESIYNIARKAEVEQLRNKLGNVK
jgi:hypothetical protein